MMRLQMRLGLAAQRKVEGLTRAASRQSRSNVRLGIAGLRTKVSHLPPATSVAGLPVLMAHYQDTNAVFKISIYDRVRKNLQRECSSSSRRWRSETWMLNQELGDTFKFFEKTLSDHRASLFAVEIQSLGNIMLRSRVERVGHR